MITGNLSADLNILYLPTLLAIVMGILGILRGTRREAIVSMSIALASLIILVWSTFWAQDLNGMFTGIAFADARNLLTYVTMGVVVLLVGYMLGSAVVPRTPLSILSRLGGFLIGVINGLAIGGFFVRTQFETALTSGNNDLAVAILDSPLATSLRILSNWFPLALAIVAGIVAIIGPFRRAQTNVATPDARTDWGPTAAPAVGVAAAAAPGPAMSAPGPAAYAAGYNQGYTGQYPQQPAPYGQPQYGQQYAPPPTQPQPYTPYPQYGQQPPPPVAPPSSAPMYSSTSYAPAPPTTPRMDDAPPTAYMPTDQPRPTPPGGQETLYIGSAPTSTPPAGDAQSKPPEWSEYGSTPSWMTSSTPASSSAEPASPPPASPPVDSSLVARAEAPTMAQPIIAPTPEPAPAPASSDTDTQAGAQADEAATSSTLINCSRCGTPVPSDATFCTECGNRMNTA